MARPTFTLCALALGSLAAAVFAHVRLIHSGNGRLVAWVDPAHIPLVISSQGSDDIHDLSYRTAIQNSIAAWNASQGTLAHIIEDESAASRARTDWAADDLHLVLFDENGSSGFFPTGSGTVALTPVWYTSSGHITDADILFNGNGFKFTTRNDPGAFDVQDIATHELGHLLGLDHSGCVGASLYPYVSPGLNPHRSISSDDEHGLRDAYPSGSWGSISGTVRRASDSTLVGGAYVAARSSAGRTVASALATSAGTFVLNGLDADDYLVYATPLDFPVSSANLTQGRIVQIDFQSTVSGSVHVPSGAAVALGDILVAGNTTFGLGRNFDPLPLTATRGQLAILSLHGTALLPGTTLTCGDPAVAVAPLAWMGNQVIFTALVPAGAPPGHVDLVATAANGDTSILCGALEIVPPAPAITTVVPAAASDAGGTALTIFGSNFQSGLRLLIGERIYEDGAPGGCTVVDAHTLTLTTAPTPGASYDVVAIDPSGVEGRLADGFLFTSIPAIESLFPAAGAAAGGTHVVLTGSGFVAGSSVRIDGVTQTQVQVTSPTQLELTTGPGQPGGPYLVEVENPGGAIASAAFSYALSPDPLLAALDPAAASSDGAVTATLHGAGFTPSTQVSFGVDAATGGGGVEALAVTFVDAETLEVLVPAHAAGVVSVMVSAPTGQAAVLPESFTYRAHDGGGSCVAVGSAAPPSVRSVLEGSGWIALAALGALWSARSRRTPARA